MSSAPLVAVQLVDALVGALIEVEMVMVSRILMGVAEELLALVLAQAKTIEVPD